MSLVLELKLDELDGDKERARLRFFCDGFSFDKVELSGDTVETLVSLSLSLQVSILSSSLEILLRNKSVCTVVSDDSDEFSSFKITLCAGTLKLDAFENVEVA